MARATTATRKPKASAERPPVISKDELRAQVEKLTKANAALRSKGRDATKAAKLAAARIAELEANIEELQKQVASSVRSEKRRARRPEIDPGDAVPPGVAVQEPAPMDAEAEQAFENLEEHLGSGKGVQDTK